MDERQQPQKQGRYYGDGGLYKNVKVPVRVVEGIILVLIAALLGCVIFGAATGGYTVSFDARGGTPVESQALEYGDLIAEPAPPTREGSEFLGWFTDEGCTQSWDFTVDAVSGSMTLYAGWSN